MRMVSLDKLISIHAAREGGDLDKKIDWTDFLEFQSTPPVMSATGKLAHCRSVSNISIHAAREGGDPSDSEFAKLGLEFQSTPPVKAATFIRAVNMRQIPFQSTPPVKAATCTCLSLKTSLLRFQSTPPVKAATYLPFLKNFVIKISIHAAREGGAQQPLTVFKVINYFRPRRP